MSQTIDLTLIGKAAFDRNFLGRRDIWRFAWQQFRFIKRGENAGTMKHIEDRALGLVAGHRADEMQQMVIDVYEDYIAPMLPACAKGPRATTSTKTCSG